MKILLLSVVLFYAAVHGQANHIVEVTNYTFNPQHITIALGDTVEWRWIQGAHTTTSDSTEGPNSWDQIISPGLEIFKFVLTSAGTHTYYCRFHVLLGMTGSITVSPTVPVELTMVTADLVDNSVLLRWTTATETNNYGFEVQRHIIDNNDANENWEKISFVEGAGTSTTYNYYSFIDNNINASGKYKYRLKQIDYDGTYAYSKTVAVNYQVPKEFTLAQNYPNPFNPNTIINFSLPADGIVTLKLFDVLGKEVETLLNESKSAGIHQIYINSNSINGGLQSGIYYYTLSSGSFSSTRKMIVLK